MELTPGTRIGTYEIVAPLGAGGMGEVYRARDLRLDRDIALKVLPASFAGDGERLARFEREARTVAGLNHPNIVVLHSIEDDGNLRFLTMELVEGQSLDQHLVPGGLPMSRVLDLGIALAAALAAAHAKGVVHRDLKPANVMLTREGRVKVLDFGLAKPLAESPVSGLDETQTTTMATPISGVGQVLGTVPYMAPEQIRGQAVDARTDLFALGIILYELATGRRPFGGATPADVSSAILRDAPAPIAAVRAELPGDLVRIVNRCLEKQPRDRFQTALEVDNELRRLRRVIERGEPVEPASYGAASIAVLPFVNRSRDDDDEYFSDGLADELLNMLSKIKGLRVVARTSSFYFKGKDVPLSEIGSLLNVDTVLDGSVRKSGSRVRISVQLVRVSDSSHLWSETYNRTLDDIFEVQDDIAQSVVKELRTTLLGEAADSNASGEAKAEVARAAKGRATDPEAHRLYLQGRYLIDRHSREDTAKGVEYLKQAVALDPRFALPWAELGLAYWNQADRSWAPVEEGYRQARHAVERALSLEPDLAEAHAVMGWIQMSYELDWRGAEVSMRRALELAPGNTHVLRRAGVWAHCLGRDDEAIALHRQAVELDPLSAATYRGLAGMLLNADRAAEAAFSKALELAPNMAACHAYLALALLALGRGEQAVAEAKQDPAEAYRLWALAIVHHGLGMRVESDAALRELVEKYPGDGAVQIADAHGARGELAETFEWLDRAHAQRDTGLASMHGSRRLRFLHGDPRWSAFLRKIGLSTPVHP